MVEVNKLYRCRQDIILNPSTVDKINISLDLDMGNTVMATIDDVGIYKPITVSEFNLAKEVLKKKAEQLIIENKEVDHVIYSIVETDYEGYCNRIIICLIPLTHEEYVRRMRLLNDTTKCFVLNR